MIGAAQAGGVTNVARLFLSVRPRAADGTEQVVRYVPGVGTGPLERLRGGVFGFGLSRRVGEAYRFLVDNYRPGDEIWLFGFSRGAFTARSTAGFVRQCSILHRREAGRLREAYRMYRARGARYHPDAPEPVAFRAAHSHPSVRIRFIGVWDTVGALGFPVSPWSPLGILNRPWRFHDTTLSSSVDHARHAVAVDERRGPFRPTMWERSERARPGEQTLGQAWFAGVHSDVGGGYDDPGLAQVALAWMIDAAASVGLDVERGLVPGGARADGWEPPEWMVARARAASLGGDDPGALVRRLAVPPDPSGPLHDSLRGVYRFLPRHPRAIPYRRRDGDRAPYPGQVVALPAAGRVRADPAYRRMSPRLAAYLAAGGAVAERW